MKRMILLILVCFLPSVVNAKLLNSEDVVSEFNNAYYLFGKAELNAEKDTITVLNSEGKKEIEFQVKEDYIEYASTQTQDGNYFGIYMLIGAVINASTDEEITLVDGFPLEDYEKYGLEIDIEDENYLSIRHCKISLDTNKIGKLIADYGVKVDNREYLSASMSVTNVTDSSIEIFLDVWKDLLPEGVSELKCNLYRKNTPSGNSVLVNDEPVDCLNGSKVIDNNLSPNTPYDHKNVVIGYKSF